jgi:SAM-dependent methyltransferase
LSADTAPTPATPPLAFTGERFVPGVRGEIWLEHWHRYHYACRYAKGMRVVDVACGEGYGSALLAQHATGVIGVDVSAEAVAHARRTYAEVPGLAFEQASCTALPLADSSVDLLVSFETLEHIQEQEAFVDEIARVLAPGGTLLMSCPNKAEYSDRRSYRNEFHVREPYREELATLLARRFPQVQWLGHRLSFHSVIAPEAAAGAGEFLEAAETSPSAPERAMAAPLYFIVVAGRMPAASAQPAPVSVLGDRDHLLYADYFAVTRAYRAELARREALEREAQSREADYSACREQLAKREAQLRKLSGLRGWLRRPLVRLGLLRD